MEGFFSSPAFWTVVGALGGAIISRGFDFLKFRTSAADTAYAGQIADLKADNARLHEGQNEQRAKYEAMLIKVAELSVEVRNVLKERDALTAKNLELATGKAVAERDLEHKTVEAKTLFDSNSELLQQLEVVAKDRDGWKEIARVAAVDRDEYLAVVIELKPDYVRVVKPASASPTSSSVSKP